jgi:signal transduction histidine kinase
VRLDLVIGALLVLQIVMIAGLLVQHRRRRRAEEALRENEAALRSSYEEAHVLARKVLTAQEVERTRLARDLHDDLSQGIAALSLDIQGLKNRQGTFQDESAQAALASLHEGIVGVARNVRALAHDLHPGRLQNGALSVALASHCHEVQRRNGLTVAFSANEDVGSLSPETSVNLYRIAQEALRNACRHAGARRAAVSLIRRNGAVELSIEDDGTGFDLSGTRRSRAGLGLVSIEERVRFLNGTANIETAPGAGTKVRVSVPAG